MFIHLTQLSVSAGSSLRHFVVVHDKSSSVRVETFRFIQIRFVSTRIARNLTNLSVGYRTDGEGFYQVAAHVSILPLFI